MPRRGTDECTDGHLPQRNSERPERIGGERIRYAGDKALADDGPQAASFDQRVGAIGTFPAQQGSRAGPAGSTADQARDNGGAHRGTQRHEDPH